LDSKLSDLTTKECLSLFFNTDEFDTVLLLIFYVLVIGYYCFVSFVCFSPQEYICEPVTFAAADVLTSLYDCVDLLKKLHEDVPASEFKRPRDEHVFDVFETAQ